MKALTLYLLLITSVCVYSDNAFSYENYHKRELNPERLNEWIIEGKIHYKGENGKEKHYFSWKQINNTSELRLKENNMSGNVIETYQNTFGSDDENNGNYHSKLLGFLADNPDSSSALSFWIRGLSFDNNESVKKNKEGMIENIETSEWEIDYKGKQTINHYHFPESIKLSHKKNGTQIKIDFLRAETGFIQSWCHDDIALDNTQYEERWIDSEEFCEQLKIVHGDHPDLKDGVFGPDSMMWELNKYIMPAGFGAGRALLLQIAHPWVTAGIDEHSVVRDDPIERGRRTYRYMYTLVYGSVPQALNAANEVHRIHQQVKGHLSMHQGTESFEPGSEYYANEMEAMIWVHATLWDTLVLTYEQLQRDLSHEEKARFYEETKLFAMLFGIPRNKLPGTWQEFQRYNRYMWRRLEVSPAARDLAHDLFHQKNLLLKVLMPIQKNFTQYNLPPRIREQYGWDELGFFGTSFYKGARLSAKITDRVMVITPGLRYNPMYKEAKDRVDGERSSWFTRSQLKSGIGIETLVN